MEAPRPCGQVWPHHRSFVQEGRLQRQPPGTVPGRGGEHGSRAWPCRHDGDKKKSLIPGVANPRATTPAECLQQGEGSQAAGANDDK